GEQKAGSTAGLLHVACSADQTLTSGPFDGGAFEPPPGPAPPPPFGPLGFGGLRLRAPGSFSGFGVTGPSTDSEPIFARPVPSSLTTTTRTWPPPLSLPNSTSSASGFLMCSWITRAIGRAPICSS